MADAAPPPSGGGGTTTPVLIRNIIVGAITTVLGSTTVYFITHGTGKSSETTTVSTMSPAEKLLVSKEVTTKAWKSYVSIDNLYYKNLKVLQASFIKNKNIMAYKEDMQKEAASFRKDVENILKEENLDESFSALLNRRLDREKESLEKMGDYMDEVDRLINADIPVSEKQEKAAAADARFNEYAQSVMQRASNELEGLSKSLSEKYMQPFSVDDFDFYSDYKKSLQGSNTNPTGDNTPNTDNNDPGTKQNNEGYTGAVNSARGEETKQPTQVNNNTKGATTSHTSRDFYGEWDVNGATITLSSNGNMSWDMDNGDYAQGTWRYSNNQIVMKATSQNGQRANWVFDLFNITPNSFTMRLTAPPYNTYYMVRYRD
mgnify:CR=1 FL=1